MAPVAHPLPATADVFDTSEIRSIVLDLLEGINVSYPHRFVVSPSFYAACKEKAIECGFHLSGQFDLGRFMEVGAVIACAAYILLDEKRRVFLAVYTAACTMLDDIATQIDARKDFASHTIEGRSHNDPTLDGLAQLLKDTSAYSGEILPDIVLASTYNFFLALTLEDMGNTVPVHPEAEAYGPYKRNHSGISAIYAAMIFPPKIPLCDFVHSLPYIINITDSINDVLSFYKEEADGETVNLVSDMANTAGITRIEVVRKLADRCIYLHKKIVAILGAGTLAGKAYDAYISGYVQFHTSLPRYRLDELNIPVGAPFLQ